MTRISIIAAAAMLTVVASPAFAQGDAPGGGPTRTPAPSSGAQVYAQVCAACHMADAKGATGAATIPALASNAKLKVAAYPIIIVLNGKGAMPPFRSLLTPAQIADAVGYVRTNFGNAYADPVTEAQVKQMMGPAAH